MKNKKRIACLLISVVLLTGCASTSAQGSTEKPNENNQKIYTKDFTFDVVPETFQLSVTADGKEKIISLPFEEKNVENVLVSEDKASWNYTKEKIEVSLEKEKNYLDVNLTLKGEEASEFDWPKVSADGYTLPLGEGKRFLSNDENWKKYLDGNTINGIESLSMQFFSADWDEFSALFVIENPYNNELSFETDNGIEFVFKHEFPSINPEKQYGFRIYITENNPVASAKTYKDYIVEKGQFKTLKQKAEENPNVEKLYGAPHFYFYTGTSVTTDDFKWEKLKDAFRPEFLNHCKELFLNNIEGGEEYVQILNDMEEGEPFYEYSKNRIANGFHELLLLKEFYKEDIFLNIDEKSQELIAKGVDSLNESELLERNKRLLFSELKTAMNEMSSWGISKTENVLDDMSKNGITKAWLGFDDWTNGLYAPSFVEKANQMGYLTATYDSYHSIHEQGNEKWSTAAFEDVSLYEEGAVQKKDGSFYEGFQGEGRKLNPTLAMESVKKRVNHILENGLSFNSWFVDCDATGEIYDDYSSLHTTTQKEDLQARIKRLSYIANDKNMVVGSEGGNDFASPYIVFAHGIETPAFSWMDKDMSKNKDSEYYLGRYYSPNEGVPEVFSKKVPLKDYYYQIFIQPRYSVPLFKLVYNDSVITTHHWAWPTTKVETGKDTRMLKEILYNVPPLYQIDSTFWEENKQEISTHSNFFSAFQKKVIEKEMTNFEVLSEDGLVQKTQYGNEIEVVANFSENSFNYQSDEIKPGSLIIYDGNEKIEYKPEVNQM